MNPTIMNAIAGGRTQEMRDHAAAIRLARDARRSRRVSRARTGPLPRSAEPVINPCPAVAAR
jgi:hypothetical protein